MHDLAKVTLQNEMDLVLAHKRSMKLAEIAGLSLASQTTFATAVSEVARNTIENGKNGCLTLGISDDKKRSIVACIEDENLDDPKNREGLAYATKLVDRLNISSEKGNRSIELYFFVPKGEKIDSRKLDEWRIMFRRELPISPYDEIKRKNEQLLELTEAIRESEDHYRLLTNTLPLMMFSLDNSGSLTYVNDWVVNYFGATMEELNNQPRHLLVHEEDRPANDGIRSVLQLQQPVKTEWRLRNSLGEYRWHLVSVLPRLQNGEVVNWFGFFVDIHTQKLFEQTRKDNQELKEMQEQLKYHIRELNRSNEELQQFAYVASHDLQEPLRKVIFYSDYFLGHFPDDMDSRSRDYLRGMLLAAQRMRTLITDLLAFSQVDKKKLDCKPVDLGRTMREAQADFEVMIAEKGATLDIGPLPSIEGDETMIRRLFENLLSNALKYSRDGVNPHIAISSSAKDNGVEVVFSDNGIGFEEKFLPKMFTLFQRLHGREKFEGTGLGLAICRKITELHHGSITAKSEVNKGSSFYVSLPNKQKTPV